MRQWTLISPLAVCGTHTSVVSEVVGVAPTLGVIPMFAGKAGVAPTLRHPGRYCEPGSIGIYRERMTGVGLRLRFLHFSYELTGHWTPVCMATGVTSEFGAVPCGGEARPSPHCRRNWRQS